MKHYHRFVGQGRLHEGLSRDRMLSRCDDSDDLRLYLLMTEPVTEYTASSSSPVISQESPIRLRVSR